MKNTIKMILVAAISVMFMACGGSNGGDKTPESAVSTTTAMAVDVPVDIDGEYSIVNASPDAVVDIIVIGQARTATLTAGTASIQKL